jgi:Holliday junction resolvasome RuvABC endonuclease subunit
VQIVGIDYSLTSPAICVWHGTSATFTVSDCDLFFLNTKKQAVTTACTFLHSESYPSWSTEEERHDLLSEWSLNIIPEDAMVYIEGYAFATVGKSHVRSVAENTGLLKYKMFKRHMTFSPIPPTTIKQFATGKGNANKDAMYQAFLQEPNAVALLELLTPKSTKVGSPVSDIVDAYFIAKTGHAQWKQSQEKTV